MVKDIYEPSVMYLQGNTVCRKVKHVKPVVVSKNLQNILNKYKIVILCCNLMHINGFAFLNKVSWGILFGDCSLINNRSVKNIEAIIKKINTLYL